jgi:hypothetical protein
LVLVSKERDDSVARIYVLHPVSASIAKVANFTFSRGWALIAYLGI